MAVDQPSKKNLNDPERLPPFFALCPLRGYMSEEKIRTEDQTDEQREAATELTGETLEQISGGTTEQKEKFRG